MYDITDKRNAIKDVQKMLYAVSEIHVSVSGIFDDNTKDAVKAFQNKKNIPETGIVDKETLDILFSEYTEFNADIPDNINFPLTYGSYSEDVRDINEKMSTILDYYSMHHRLRSSPRYSQETENAVKKMRQIYFLDNSAEIDKELFLRIERDHKSIPYK